MEEDFVEFKPSFTNYKNHIFEKKQKFFNSLDRKRTDKPEIRKWMIKGIRMLEEKLINDLTELKTNVMDDLDPRIIPEPVVHKKSSGGFFRKKKKKKENNKIIVKLSENDFNFLFGGILTTIEQHEVLVSEILKKYEKVGERIPLDDLYFNRFHIFETNLMEFFIKKEERISFVKERCSSDPNFSMFMYSRRKNNSNSNNNNNFINISTGLTIYEHYINKYDEYVTGLGLQFRKFYLSNGDIKKTLSRTMDLLEKISAIMAFNQCMVRLRTLPNGGNELRKKVIKNNEKMILHWEYELFIDKIMVELYILEFGILIYPDYEGMNISNPEEYFHEKNNEKRIPNYYLPLNEIKFYTTSKFQKSLDDYNNSKKNEKKNENKKNKKIEEEEEEIEDDGEKKKEIQKKNKNSIIKNSFLIYYRGNLINIETNNNNNKSIQSSLNLKKSFNFLLKNIHAQKLLVLKASKHKFFNELNNSRKSKKNPFFDIFIRTQL